MQFYKFLSFFFTTIKLFTLTIVLVCLCLYSNLGSPQVRPVDQSTIPGLKTNIFLKDIVDKYATKRYVFDKDICLTFT